MQWPESGEIAALVGVPLLLAALLLAETFLPLRPAASSTAGRWAIHAMLYLFSLLIAVVLVPEQWARGFAVFTWLDQAYGAVAAGILGVLALDLAFYLIHRLQHASGFLWRLHVVHHCDLDVDVTTAVRHHPGESLINSLCLGGLVVLLGIPPSAIAVYGALAIAVQLIQHANLGWPASAERVVRLLFVTPALHRKHHSRDRSVSDTNFGLIFSIWDRVLRTFDSRSPVAAFGVYGIDWAQSRTLWAILALPLARQSRDDGTPSE